MKPGDRLMVKREGFGGYSARLTDSNCSPICEKQVLDNYSGELSCLAGFIAGLSGLKRVRIINRGEDFITYELG